jgi:hypothetical protein
MPDAETRTPSQAHNAFSASFLSRFEELDEPASAGEADLEGPWSVSSYRTADGGTLHAVWRSGEGWSSGDLPAAGFQERSTALLACALRPVVGREPYFRLAGERQALGFALERHGEARGWIGLFDESWAFAINVLERFVRSPEALATLLEAAGPLALERAGRALHRRVAARDEGEPGGAAESLPFG